MIVTVEVGDLVTVVVGVNVGVGVGFSNGEPILDHSEPYFGPGLVSLIISFIDGLSATILFMHYSKVSNEYYGSVGVLVTVGVGVNAGVLNLTRKAL